MTEFLSATASWPSVAGFTLLEKLGSGSYASVYKALRNSGEPPRDIVAIKCIDRAKTRSKEAGDNVVDEIRILKTLRHRYIVELFDFTWDQRYIYLMTEYCEGGDLSEFIRSHRALPEGVARKFLQQLARALQYLRERNVSHMDLKPSNILLSSRQPPVSLKLADFGFARILGDEHEGQTSLRGSPLYMAPEIFTQRVYDARCDLWSVGVILYECIFGKAPFSSDSLETLMQQVNSTKPILIPMSVPIAGDTERPSSARVRSPRPQPPLRAASDGSSTAPTKPLSAACHSLLDGLLRRDPERRLTFEQFFRHRFLDLDHAPSEDALRKAERFAAEAEDADRLGLVSRALKLYSKSVEYFLHAMQWVETSDERARLRARAEALLRRAEALKAMEASPQPLSARRVPVVDAMPAKNNGETSLLLATWSDVPEVAAAFTVVSSAKDCERREEWGRALEKYQLAIGPLLAVLQAESKSSGRRAQLRAIVDGWISKAEMLKNCRASEEDEGPPLSDRSEGSCESGENVANHLSAVVKTEDAVDQLVREHACVVQ